MASLAISHVGYAKMTTSPSDNIIIKQWTKNKNINFL